MNPQLIFLIALTGIAGTLALAIYGKIKCEYSPFARIYWLMAATICATVVTIASIGLYLAIKHGDGRTGYFEVVFGGMLLSLAISVVVGHFLVAKNSIVLGGRIYSASQVSAVMAARGYKVVCTRRLGRSVVYCEDANGERVVIQVFAYAGIPIARMDNKRGVSIVCGAIMSSLAT